MGPVDLSLHPADLDVERGASALFRRQPVQLHRHKDFKFLHYHAAGIWISDCETKRETGSV